MLGIEEHCEIERFIKRDDDPDDIAHFECIGAGAHGALVGFENIELHARVIRQDRPTALAGTR